MERYKFLRLVDGRIKSEYGNTVWEKDKWKTLRGKLELCEKGFHCSAKVFDALTYVAGEIVAKVEVDGKCVIQMPGSDKEAWSKMRLVKVYEWTKEDSVALSIYAAELCIANYEKEYPEDDRPRKAIEAAKAWLDNPSSENQEAVWSARSAARSARSAARSAAEWNESAAESAAWSAESAAWSAAWSAVWSARSAARSAAESAESAVWSAAESAAKEAILNQIEEWMQARLEGKEEYDGRPLV